MAYVNNCLFTSDNEVVVATNLSFPNSLALDWVGRNLFWTSNDQKSIEVSRIDGSNRAVLISDMLERPCDLAIHPVKGYSTLAYLNAFYSLFVSFFVPSFSFSFLSSFLLSYNSSFLTFFPSLFPPSLFVPSFFLTFFFAKPRNWDK